MEALQDALDFIEAFESFILTTHSGADADGIGAEILLAGILDGLGKRVRILNAERVGKHFAFLDPEGRIEQWDPARHFQLPAHSGMIILDTSDEFNIGSIGEEALPHALGTMLIDHHEPAPMSRLTGYIDTSAASTTEIVAGIAEALGIQLDKGLATAALTGLVYDTGSFAYPKTTARSFRTALALVEAGAVPSEVHRSLFESGTMETLLLQKKVIASLELHAGGSVATQILDKKDLEETGASYEDAEGLINIPLQCKDVQVSILVKQNEEGLIRCSLRAKGIVNVSQIAQMFGGGGHRTAAGFKSRLGLAETKAEVLQRVISALEQ